MSSLTGLICQVFREITRNQFKCKMYKKPLAAYPSEGRRRLRVDNAVSELISDHTSPFGQDWRGLTHCKLKQ